MKKDLVIIGGGPAGMAAAAAAYDWGVRDMVLVERDTCLGGILNQCIHNGFGLQRFNEELTGPEYAARYEEMVQQRQIPCLLGTIVTRLEQTAEGSYCVTAMDTERGLFTVEAKAVVLAMGCRERPRGSMNIPGARPAGIYTAGTAQKYVNRMGHLPGKEAVIIGSGDIGLIMARRLTLEGAKVKAVCELMPYSGGLARNIEQCLNDFDIPLRLSCTVTEIHGTDRVTGVTVMDMDPETHAPVAGTEEEISCDTLLLSVGLIPENELTQGAGIALDPVTGGAFATQDRETDHPGVFACGNVLHVHDLVDHVSEEAAIAGKAAAKYLMRIGALEIPQGFDPSPNNDAARFAGKKPPLNWKEQFLRSNRPGGASEAATVNPDGSRDLTCIVCPRGCSLHVTFDKEGAVHTVTGNSCPKGETYAVAECTNPMRMVTSVMRTEDGGLVSVRTKETIAKKGIPAVMDAINRHKAPKTVQVGQVLVAEVAGTDIVATANYSARK